MKKAQTTWQYRCQIPDGRKVCRKPLATVHFVNKFPVGAVAESHGWLELTYTDPRLNIGADYSVLVGTGYHPGDEFKVMCIKHGFVGVITMGFGAGW